MTQISSLSFLLMPIFGIETMDIERKDVNNCFKFVSNHFPSQNEFIK